MTAKAVAFITRPAPGGKQVELLVFSHPMAGVQLPSGSLFDNENPLAGCIREAWEETGLRAGGELELVGAVGTWVEPESGLTRHAFHFRLLRETPEEWWVITPDGHGLCWRCWWTPLDGTEPIHPLQRRWLDRVRFDLEDDPARELSRAPARPRPFDSDDAAAIFAAPPLAPGGAWALTSWEPGPLPDGLPLVCAHALCVTDRGMVVLVAHAAVDQQGNDFLAWGPPGGTVEAGESVDAALVREVQEEACAAVRDLEWLGYAQVALLGTEGEVTRVDAQARAFATVDLAAWKPEFEIVERRLVPLADVIGELPYWRHPVNERWLVAGMERARARARTRSRHG